MPERVRVTDVSPRDGLQNEPTTIDTARKLELVEALCAAGFDEVEVTSFVSPKWVPQLADARELLGLVHEFAQGVRTVSASLPGSHVALPVFSVLVPNEKGFERALEVHRSGLPLKIALFTAASETFSQRNTNASIAETIERFRAFLPRAFEERMPVRLYVSCAVACPFEGPIAADAVARVAHALLNLAPNDEVRWSLDLDLGDTIGVATTDQIRALLECFDPDLRRRQLTLHLHDTFARAADCVRAALDMGVRSFDGSAGGLGGCPYAGTPERRAPGNIASEVLVRTVHDAGFVTGVDPDLLADAALLARAMSR